MVLERMLWPGEICVADWRNPRAKDLRAGVPALSHATAASAQAEASETALRKRLDRPPGAWNLEACKDGRVKYAVRSCEGIGDNLQEEKPIAGPKVPPLKSARGHLSAFAKSVKPNP